MCESSIILDEGGSRKKVMEEASKVEVEGEDIIAYDILGNQKTFKKCKLVEVDSINHTITLTK